MIAVTNVTNVMIVTNVIKKFESLQRGWFQPNPFVTTKNLYIPIVKVHIKSVWEKNEESLLVISYFPHFG